MQFFILLPLLWILRAIWIEVDPVFVWRLLSINIDEALRIFGREYRLIFQACVEIFNISVFFLFISFCVRNRQSKIIERVQYLLFSVYSFFGIVSLVKYFDIVPGLFQSSWNFWMGVNRFSGVFTDPNSLGLCASLCALWYLERSLIHRHMSSFAFCLMWIFLGMMSGSRTFFLIVGCSTFFYFIKSFVDNQKFHFSNHWSKLCLVVIVMVSIPYIVHRLSETTDIIGIKRLSKMLDPDSVQEELSSRSIFFQVNYFLFKESPLFGVGFNQFDRNFVRASHDLGFKTENWKDNPNSFYFGICSELGLVGLVLFLIGLTGIQFKSLSQINLMAAGGYSFLLSLLVGCHLDFFEVALLSPFFVEKTVKQIHGIPYRLKYTALVLLLISALYIYCIPKSDYGYFRNKNELYVRRTALITVDCGRDFTVDAPLMNNAKAPFKVSINGSFYTVSDSKPFTFSPRTCKDHEKTTTLSIQCSRFFLADRPYCVRLK